MVPPPPLPLPSPLSSLFFLLFLILPFSNEQQQQLLPIHNVRAHYDAGTDTILVDWEWREVDGKELEDYALFVRYKVSSQSDDEWHRVPSDEDAVGAKIPAGRMLNNGDELTVQVFAEPRDPEEDGGVGKEQSDPLVIWIAKRAESSGRGGNSALAEEELIPPFNFTASILGTGQVRLEWRHPPLPSPAVSPFYIVNVRQLSENTGDTFRPQQLRVDGTHFVLSNLVSGEKYEFTIRTALGADRLSSAAAIVEIAIPAAEDMVDVGNLIVSSRFRPDAHGVVNLTWEVPTHLRGKIQSYEMRYVDAALAQQVEAPFWEQLIFPGHAPTAEIFNMKPDTEYVLRIRTTMTSGIQVQSGEFRFRTPKSGTVNPIARLDVLYSSETPTVRLQWMLAPHINMALIGGYDVFISSRYDVPEGEWQSRRVQGRDPQLALDSLNPATTYFVRIDVRNLDGTQLKSQSAYRFTTLDNLPVPSRRDLRRSDSLAFQQIGPGRVSIQWELPESVKLASKGISIFYNSDPREPLDRWHRLNADKNERSVELVGVRENANYDVQIVPIGVDGRQMWMHAQRMQLKTKAEREAEGEAEAGEESGGR